jgi:hypothetical protein
MPPKRKTAAGARRSVPAARRQKTAAAAAAEPAEESTTVEVYGFHKDWLAPLYEMYTKRELYDTVLIVGDQSVAAHRVVLATVSPYLRKMFGSGMAESKSKEVQLEGVPWVALQAIVDFSYTGKIVLAGSTVVAIIRTANLLQVTAVEQAAVDFLAERLDAGNVLDAMALGIHLSAGEIGRELRDRSRGWLNKNFGLAAAEPSFLALPSAEVVELVDSDDLEAEEESVFEFVMNWVKEDEAVRKLELDRLLPLVRFPMMKDGARAIMAEPLLAQHPLAAQLVAETLPQFAASARAECCPRLRPRVMPFFCCAMLLCSSLSALGVRCC